MPTYSMMYGDIRFREPEFEVSQQGKTWSIIGEFIRIDGFPSQGSALLAMRNGRVDSGIARVVQ